jgi:hypothetical protein
MLHSFPKLATVASYSRWAHYYHHPNLVVRKETVVTCGRKWTRIQEDGEQRVES